MKKAKKVREEYLIDLNLLEDLVLQEVKGDFFAASLKFYKEVEDREVRSLSKKQKNWLWELSCILHDRAESRAATKSDQAVSAPIVLPTPQKKSLLDKILSYFRK